jgi:hypothetical protein
MAASSRSSARRSGFWHDQPSSISTRPTWARWSRTRNSRWMTVAIRRVVHRSVSNPHVLAPRSKSWGSRARCCSDNFGGRPLAGLARSAAEPRRRTVSRQRITELCEHPTRRATSVMEAPAFSKSMARRRRRSSSSGVPRGRILRQYATSWVVSIIYAHVNSHTRRRDGVEGIRDLRP